MTLYLCIYFILSLHKCLSFCLDLKALLKRSNTYIYIKYIPVQMFIPESLKSDSRLWDSALISQLYIFINNYQHNVSL